MISVAKIFWEIFKNSFLVLGRSTAKSAKAAARKQENTEKRAEHREQLKEAQPAPMIKELHEIRDEGDDVALEFLRKCF